MIYVHFTNIRTADNPPPGVESKVFPDVLLEIEGVSVWQIRDEYDQVLASVDDCLNERYGTVLTYHVAISSRMPLVAEKTIIIRESYERYGIQFDLPGREVNDSQSVNHEIKKLQDKLHVKQETKEPAYRTATEQKLYQLYQTLRRMGVDAAEIYQKLDAADEDLLEGLRTGQCHIGDIDPQIGCAVVNNFKVFIVFERQNDNDIEEATNHWRATHKGLLLPDGQAEYEASLLLQFQRELDSNPIMESYKILHSEVSLETTLVWCLFTWKHPLAEFFYHLQQTYDRDGMSGEWNVKEVLNMGELVPAGFVHNIVDRVLDSGAHSERWIFTDAELRFSGKGTTAVDLFVSHPAELDLGVLVGRNGLATNSWADGTVGVSDAVRDCVEDNEVLQTIEGVEVGDNWCDVFCDNEGRFICFTDFER